MAQADRYLEQQAERVWEEGGRQEPENRHAELENRCADPESRQNPEGSCSQIFAEIDGKMCIRDRANDEQGNPVSVNPDQHVSMNMWGLPPRFLEELETGFPEFLDNIPEGNLKAEYLLPRIIDKLIKSGKGKVKVLETRDKW